MLLNFSKIIQAKYCKNVVETYRRGSLIIQMDYFSYLQNFCLQQNDDNNLIVYILLNSFESYIASSVLLLLPTSNVKTGPSFMHGVVREYVCECLCLYVYKRIFAKIVYIMKFTAWLHLLLHGFTLNNTKRETFAAIQFQIFLIYC